MTTAEHPRNRMHPSGKALWICEKCWTWEKAPHFGKPEMYHAISEYLDSKKRNFPKRYFGK